MWGPDQNPEEIYTCHKHQPAHLFRAGATYFITAKTLLGAPILAPAQRRRELLDSLDFACRQRGWIPIAWVVLSNHYHAILGAPQSGASSLAGLIGAVHSYTSRRWNNEDGEPGRRVWYQYWDVCLTGPGSFYARPNYSHYNPVKHGYVNEPADYPFSSHLLWQSKGADELGELEEAYPWDWLDLEH